MESTLERFQFRAMQFRESREHLFAGFLQMHLDLPAVGLADLPADQVERLAARHQRNHAVMLRLKPLGQFADGCPVASG